MMQTRNFSRKFRCDQLFPIPFINYKKNPKTADMFYLDFTLCKWAELVCPTCIHVSSMSLKLQLNYFLL